jgi:hypothetical protein
MFFDSKREDKRFWANNDHIFFIDGIFMALVNTVMNLRVASNVGKFLSIK